MHLLLSALLLPFLGTMVGAACVFLMRNKMPVLLQKTLLGFASGVMVAASVWSLLIPAMEMEDGKGKWAVMPAAIGLLCGMAFLLFTDRITPHLHLDSNQPEGPKTGLSRTTMLVLAVTLHNLPEGMAVGVLIAAALESGTFISGTAALALAVGIALQNIPEGAIVSMPMRNEGHSKFKSFLIGTASGVVEPLGTLLTLWLATAVTPILPYLLAFAAGAMLYVVIEELIPESAQGKHSNLGTIGFAFGFVMMMILDVVLG